MPQRRSLVHALDRQTFIDNTMASEQPPPLPETKSSRISPVQERGSTLQERAFFLRRRIKKSFTVVDKKIKTQKNI